MGIKLEDLLIQHALAYCNKNDPESSKDEKELRNRILARDEEQRKVIDLQDRICKKYYARIKELEAQIETWQEILNLP